MKAKEVLEKLNKLPITEDTNKNNVVGSSLYNKYEKELQKYVGNNAQELLFMALDNENSIFGGPLHRYIESLSINHEKINGYDTKLDTTLRSKINGNEDKVKNIVKLLQDFCDSLE